MANEDEELPTASSSATSRACTSSTHGADAHIRRVAERDRSIVGGFHAGGVHGQG